MRVYTLYYNNKVFQRCLATIVILSYAGIVTGLIILYLDTRMPLSKRIGGVDCG
jgi:hypothetical protein